MQFFLFSSKICCAEFGVRSLNVLCSTSCLVLGFIVPYTIVFVLKFVVQYFVFGPFVFGPRVCCAVLCVYT